MLLGTTDGEARNLPTYIAVYRLACKKQHEYFARSAAEQSLTSQVVSPTGSPGLGLAALVLQPLPPIAAVLRRGSLRSEGGSGWGCRSVALQGRQRGAALREQRWLPGAQIIPLPACGIRQRFPGRRRSSLGGLVQKQRRLHSLLGVLLCRALHSLQNGKHVSWRHAERNGSLVSVCLRRAAFCGGLRYHSSHDKGSAARRS